MTAFSRRQINASLLGLIAPASTLLGDLARAQSPACQAPPADFSASAAKPPYLLGPVALPAARSLRYEGPIRIKGVDAKARSQWTWQHDGQQYQLEVKTRLLLMELTESSSGTLGSEGLRPVRFERKGAGGRSASLDARTRQIGFDKGPCATWVSGVQDSVSVFVQLAALMAGAPAKYPKGATIILPVAHNRSLRAWRFKLDSEETLNLRGAPNLRCLKVLRLGDHPAEIWLAPSMGYWPVRIKVQDEDDALDQSLRL